MAGGYQRVLASARRLGLVFGASLAAPAVAAQPDFAALAAADARVAAVAWRLQTANTALCREVTALPGLTIQTLDQFGLADRAAAKQAGVTDRPTIAAVVSDSAASRSGLSAGDVVLAIDGAPTPIARAGSGASYEGADQTLRALEFGLTKPPVDLAIAKGTSQRRVTLAGDRGCASRIELVTSASPNGRADGRVVQITAGLYDLVTNDDELAAVIAHELAHNILGHRTRLDAARVSVGLFAGLGRNGAMLRQTEAEADRLSVWLVARAGYKPDVLAPLWSRLGERLGQGLLSDGTHPSWQRRIAQIEGAVAEVHAQRAAGVALVPPSQSRNPR